MCQIILERIIVNLPRLSEEERGVISLLFFSAVEEIHGFLSDFLKVRKMRIKPAPRGLRLNLRDALEMVGAFGDAKGCSSQQRPDVKSKG